MSSIGYFHYIWGLQAILRIIYEPFQQSYTNHSSNHHPSNNGANNSGHFFNILKPIHVRPFVCVDVFRIFWENPTGVFGPGIFDLPPIQPFHTNPTVPMGPVPPQPWVFWVRYSVALAPPDQGGSSVWLFAGVWNSGKPWGVSKKKLGEIRMKQQTACGYFCIPIFPMPPGNRRQKCQVSLWDDPTPQKGKKNTCAPHWPTPYDATEGGPWFWWRFDTPSYPRWLACNQSPSNSSTSADGPWTIYPLHSLRTPPPKVCVDSLCLKIKT